MKVVCFIFARGGSKGIPNKNLQILGGKSLLEHSIHLAIEHPLISSVYVSTDDPTIAQHAQFSGAQVPFLRPAYLATDTSSEIDAWKHAVQWYFDNVGDFDTFLSLPCTSPFRALIDITNCLTKLSDTPPADGVITVTPSQRSPFFNIVTTDQSGRASLALGSDSSVHRRQDAPPTYDITTVAYAFRPRHILSTSHLFDGQIHTVVVPPERSLDIDTPLDLQYAHFLLDQDLIHG